MTRPFTVKSALITTAALATATVLAACSNPSISSATSTGATAGTSSAPAGGSSSPPASLKKDDALYNALPTSIKSAGKIVVATIDSQPPWALPASDPTKFTGASSDMLDALQTVLGVTLQRSALPGLPEVLPGIQAKRYAFALGPVGDTAKAEKQVDFIDWEKEKSVFLVTSGDPKGLSSLDATCGARMAVIAGGNNLDILNTQTAACKKAGKPPVTILQYATQPQAILALESGRADGYFASEALLTYYVRQSKGKLQLASTNSDNGHPDNFYQGAVFPKGSTQLRDVILSAFKVLKADGEYDQILSKYGLGYMSINNFGLNLVGAGA